MQGIQGCVCAHARIACGVDIGASVSANAGFFQYEQPAFLHVALRRKACGIRRTYSSG